MIEGLKCHIQGAKLQAVIREQVGKQQSRANRLEKMLAEAGDDPEASPSVSNARQVSDKVEALRKNAEELAFIADNLNTGEVYELDREDLVHIGVIANRW